MAEVTKDVAKHQLKTSVIYCGDNLQMLKEIPDEIAVAAATLFLLHLLVML